MCCTYVSKRSSTTRNCVRGEKVAYQRCQFRSVYRSFSAFFFFRNSSSSTNYFSLMVPKGVFRDFSHSGMKTEKNSAKNVICHVFISTKQVAKICTYKKIRR